MANATTAGDCPQKGTHFCNHTPVTTTWHLQIIPVILSVLPSPFLPYNVIAQLNGLTVAQTVALQLAGQVGSQTGLSKSALGKYESDEARGISPFSIATLAKLYGVSADYLLGMAEDKSHPNTELAALHLSDDAIDKIKNWQFNKRLLSELLAHEKIQRLMLDAEIYVDRIANARINDLNFMLEISRKQAALQYAPGESALNIRTLELAQIQTDDYFGRGISDDLTGILKDIREAHMQDATTADDISVAEEVGKRLQDAMNYEGNKQEKQARVYLASIFCSPNPV